MEKYTKLMEELKYLFPHSTDIRIEIDTNQADIDEFTRTINEYGKTAFFISTGIPQRSEYKSIRNPFGMITLNKK